MAVGAGLKTHVKRKMGTVRRPGVGEMFLLTRARGISSLTYQEKDSLNKRTIVTTGRKSKPSTPVRVG